MGKPGPGTSSDPSGEIRELLEELREECRLAREDRQQLHRDFSTVAQLVGWVLGPVPDPDSPVPQALADAMNGGEGTEAAPVKLPVSGRDVTAFIRGGTRLSPVTAWAAIRAAVPQDPASGPVRLAHAPLGAAVPAVSDGSLFVLSSDLSGEEQKRALRAVLRQGRSAGVAIPAAVWALLRHGSRLRWAGAAAGTGAPTAAGLTAAAGVAAVAAAGAAGMVLAFGTASHGHPFPSALTPAASVQGSLAGARAQPPGQVPGAGLAAGRAHKALPGVPGYVSQVISQPSAARGGHGSTLSVTVPGGQVRVGGLPVPHGSPPSLLGLGGHHGLTGSLGETAGGTVGKTVSGLGTAAAGLTRSLGGTVGGVTSGLGSTAGQIGAAVGGAVGGLGSQLGGTVGQVTGALGGDVGSVAKDAGGLTSQAGKTAGQVTSGLGKTVQGVTGDAGKRARHVARHAAPGLLHKLGHGLGGL